MIRRALLSGLSLSIILSILLSLIESNSNEGNTQPVPESFQVYLELDLLQGEHDFIELAKNIKNKFLQSQLKLKEARSFASGKCVTNVSNLCNRFKELKNVLTNSSLEIKVTTQNGENLIIECKDLWNNLDHNNIGFPIKENVFFSFRIFNLTGKIKNKDLSFSTIGHFDDSQISTRLISESRFDQKEDKIKSDYKLANSIRVIMLSSNNTIIGTASNFHENPDKKNIFKLSSTFKLSN